jgi:hypothetical protein
LIRFVVNILKLQVSKSKVLFVNVLFSIA